MKIHYSTRSIQRFTLVALTVAYGCSGTSGQPSPSSAVGTQGGAVSDPTTLSAAGGNLNSSSNSGGATNGGAPNGGATNGGATSPAGGSGVNAGGNSTASTTTSATGGTSTSTTAQGGSAKGGSSSSSSVVSGSGGNVTGGARTGGATSTGASATAGTATGGVRTSSSSSTGGATSSGGANSTGGATATGGGSSSATPSSGCSLTSVTTGTTIDGKMTVGGTERTYRLSVPADYKPGEALPLIFVLNGVGGTGPQAQQMFQVEAGHRAIFMYPTALPSADAGGSIAWDFKVNGVDVPYFDAMVTFLEQNYCVDTSKIFALGASSGGIMSNMLGCFRGDVLRAIAPSSGMTWQQSGCKGDVAVMIICGAQDTYNACDDAKNGGVSQTNVWVPQNACTNQTAASPISSICSAYQGCKGPDPVLLCKHAGGHGWPTSNGDFWWQFFMSLS